MEETQNVLSDEVFLHIKPRQWWIFFDLVEPRTLSHLVLRSGLAESSVRSHLRVLATHGAIAVTPSVGSGETHYGQAVKLTDIQEEHGRRKIRSARLAPPRLSIEVPTPATRSVVVGPLRSSLVEQNSIAVSKARQADNGVVSTRIAQSDAIGGTANRPAAWAGAVVVLVAALTITVLVFGTAKDDRGAGLAESPLPGTSKAEFGSKSAGAPSPEVRPEGESRRQSQPEPESEAERKTVVTDENVADRTFIFAVRRGNYPAMQEYTDGQLMHLGKALCADMDVGYDPYGLISQIDDGVPGADHIEAAGFLGTAMAAYCPEHNRPR